MPRYRVVLQERNREIYLVEAKDVQGALDLVNYAVNEGQRDALARDDSDPRWGCDELTISAEPY